METIPDVLFNRAASTKDVQSSPQVETLMEVLKLFGKAVNEVRVGVLAQRTLRV